MRNALVLVLLCIGLTSGFIVPSTTRTSQMKEITERTLKSKKDANTTIAVSAVEYETTEAHTLQLFNNTEDEMKNELYKQGSEENKNINERSFVFVNQRWKKIPSKSQLVDTMRLNNELNAKNVSKKSSENVKRTNENKRNTNKEYFLPVNQDEDKLLNNTIKKNQQQDVNKMHKKYFLVFDKLTSNAPEINKNKKKIDHKVNEPQKNNPIFKDTGHEQNIVSKEDVLWAHKQLQRTLEEQTPNEELSLKIDNKNARNFKYCQECIQKDKFRMAASNADTACKCKCGTFQHLKEAPNFKTYSGNYWRGYI